METPLKVKLVNRIVYIVRRFVTDSAWECFYLIAKFLDWFRFGAYLNSIDLRGCYWILFAHIILVWYVFPSFKENASNSADYISQYLSNY